MPATSITDAYTTVLTSVFAHREKGIHDSIVKQNPLIYYLKQKGRYKPATGKRIEIPVMYKLRSGPFSYSGFDVFNVTELDNVTLEYVNWKHYEVPIVVGGVDSDVINTGQTFYDILDTAEETAVNSMTTQLNTDLYGDGTGNGSKNVTGLAAAVAENPTTGTLYGINRATAGNEWHRNQVVNQGSGGTGVAAIDGSVTPAKHTMRRGMNRLHQLCGRLAYGGPKNRYPDLILCSEGYFLAYDDSLNHNQRYVNTDMANAGFNTLKFKNATMVEDQDCPRDQTNTAASGGLYSQKAFFLNTYCMRLYYAPKRNFKVFPFQRPINQDVYVAHLFWSGELAICVASKHGVHIGILEVAA